MLTLEEGARRVVRTCAGVRVDERVLVVYDRIHNAAPAWAIRRAATSAGANAHVRMVDQSERERACFDAIVDELVDVDVVIAFTDRSVMFTSAAAQVLSAGGRLLGFTKAEERTLTGGAIEADFPAVATQCERLATRLTEASEVEVLTGPGTKFYASLRGRSGLACTGMVHRSGQMVRLPYTGALVAPEEATVEGRIVIDGSTTFGLVDTPVTLTVEHGEVVAVSGGKAARVLEEWLNTHDEDSRKVGIIGAGLNPTATLVGHIDQDIAVRGTAHGNIGANGPVLNGSNGGASYLEFVYDRPTMLLDGTEVVHDGDLTLW